MGRTQHDVGWVNEKNIFDTNETGEILRLSNVLKNFGKLICIAGLQGRSKSVMSSRLPNLNSLSRT